MLANVFRCWGPSGKPMRSHSHLLPDITSLSYLPKGQCHKPVYRPKHSFFVDQRHNRNILTRTFQTVILMIILYV